MVVLLADSSRSRNVVHIGLNLNYARDLGRERQVIRDMKMKILFECQVKITESL